VSISVFEDHSSYTAYQTTTCTTNGDVAHEYLGSNIVAIHTNDITSLFVSLHDMAMCSEPKNLILHVLLVPR
jgi:hypothetical protein